MVASLKTKKFVNGNVVKVLYLLFIDIWESMKVYIHCSLFLNLLQNKLIFEKVISCTSMTFLSLAINIFLLKLAESKMLCGKTFRENCVTVAPLLKICV